MLYQLTLYKGVKYSVRNLTLSKAKSAIIFNPNYALELRNEGLNTHKSGSFMGFSIAPLW